MQRLKTTAAIAAFTSIPLSAQAALSVSFKAPTSGQTVSGTLQGTSCEVSGSQIHRVVFSIDGTPLNTDTGSPWNCVLDTTGYANGQHTVMALAYDRRGRTASTQITLNIQNGSTTPPPPAPASAVPTFESIGLYWKPGSNPGAAGCAVQYRRQGDADWKDGLALWYDSRNSECRGSLVHLAAGTTYEIRLALPGQPPATTLTATTWNEQFPIARTVTLQSGSQMIDITEGGTKDGYVLYTGPATLDVANAADHNVRVFAPYVIVRGLTLKGARIDAVKMFQGAHDVVIEGNDISGWGRWSGRYSSDGWQIGENEDSAIKAYCNAQGPWLQRVVIQQNKIHDPRYGSNSWSDGHPYGPNAIAFFECGGNHVFRYNDIWSSWGKYYMDAIGGGQNFSTKGFPNADTDVYGNRVQHVWDDAIEAEGANANVRIWGNYMDQTAAAIATTSTSIGPVYVFRNVWNRSRHYSMLSLDGDSRMYMMKSGSVSGYGDGRRYMFHNTMLQAPPPPGSTYPLGGGEGLSAPGTSQPLTNTVSRNNIWHIWKSWWTSVATHGGAGNDLDYDLVNGNVSAYAGAEANRITGTPIYAAGHGWAAEGSGNYQLAPGSLGYDRAVRIPNFNDAYTGAAPDIGAHEAGTAAMRLGVN